MSGIESSRVFAKTFSCVIITLSYFIEPSPGERGWKDRYRYASHGLRFDINSSLETKEQFIARINVAARNDDFVRGETVSASDHWIIGQNCDKGSIHSDIWHGTAIELAGSHFIAVYPTGGWWKDRKRENRYNNKIRYSLIVTIKTPEQAIDIYTPIAQQLRVEIPINV